MLKTKAEPSLKNKIKERKATTWGKLVEAQSVMIKSEVLSEKLPL